jgi:hypothetical protein
MEFPRQDTLFQCKMSLKGRLGRAARGLVRRYAEKMTGLSRAQLTRLIARYTASGRVQAAAYRRQRFPQRYSRADLELLAAVDEAHETLGGPATRRILECEFEVYKRPEYARRFPHSLRPATARLSHLQSPKKQNPASPTLRFLQALPSIGKDCKQHPESAPFTTPRSQPTRRKPPQCSTLGCEAHGSNDSQFPESLQAGS